MLRLLIAEDERPLLRALSKLLGKDYEIREAENGKQALEILLEGGCDLAVMDVMMPVMDGLEALSAAREAGVEVPVLLLTALSETDDKVAGLDGGANDYLTKPFEAAELAARLRSLSRACRRGKVAFADFAFDPGNGRIEGPAGGVGAGPAEAAVLRLLAEAGGGWVEGPRLARAAGGEGKAEVCLAYLSGKLRAVRAGCRVARRGQAAALAEEAGGD